jgi:hypothetical protein
MRWHLRALLGHRRWRSTTEQIAAWLATTRPASRHLLLIGGSAGWMMSSAWLQRFEQIDVVDLDALAPTLFRLNHGRALRASATQLRFHRLNAMTGLPSLLAAYPRASIFFDNVLGQHRFRMEEDLARAEAELRALAGHLRGRDWGSVHDLFSGPLLSSANSDTPALKVDADNTPTGLLAHGLQGDTLHRHLLAQVHAKGPWMDHLTSNVFPVGTQNALIAWPFSPTYGHWLQAGWIDGD